MQTYRPKERNIYAVKYVSLEQLKKDLGSAFVREPEFERSNGCPDPGGAVARVLNASTVQWQNVYQGDYVVKTASGAYEVHNGMAFEAKYEHVVTRDQGFTPRSTDFATQRIGGGGKGC